MTYCIGIRLNAGLVFLSDSRTNAGIDQISTFRKMIVYEKPGDRFMVMLSAGNLSISQSVREILQVENQSGAEREQEPDAEERDQHDALSGPEVAAVDADLDRLILSAQDRRHSKRAGNGGRAGEHAAAADGSGENVFHGPVPLLWLRR